MHEKSSNGGVDKGRQVVYGLDLKVIEMPTREGKQQVSVVVTITDYQRVRRPLQVAGMSYSSFVGKLTEKLSGELESFELCCVQEVEAKIKKYLE